MAGFVWFHGVYVMMPDEYSMPLRPSRIDARSAGRDGQRTARGEASQPAPRRQSSYRSWILRTGVLAVLVFVGVVCVGLLDANSVKTRVLLGVASAYPHSAQAYSFLKRHYTTPAKSADTVVACEQLAVLKPKDSGTQVLLGNAYVDVGRFQEAIACYRKALALEADCFDAHLGLGRAHFGRGRYSDAIDSYERALRIRPGSADAHLSLGIALSSSGRYDEAMQAFRKAKELDPQVTETQVLTGRAYMQAGLYSQAIECLKDAVRTDQRHAQAYYNLGRAYLRVGDTGLALEQHNILQSLNPRLADQLLSMIQN